MTHERHFRWGGRPSPAASARGDTRPPGIILDVMKDLNAEREYLSEGRIGHGVRPQNNVESHNK